MGFFDSLKKIVNLAESVSKQVNSSTSSSSAPKSTKPAASGASEKKTPQNIFASGNTPAKESVLIEDEYGDKKYTFKLSGDFIEFDSHCEMMPSFQYEPDNSEDYTEYLKNYPNISIGPNDTVYGAVENCTPVGKDYEKLDNKYFAFKTKLPYYGMIIYCYGFRDGTAREREMFGVTYNKDIEGTPLEKKLMAALDEAVQTYKEEIIIND